VIVAALRSKRGASSELLRQLAHVRFGIALSAPMVFEYEEVLLRDLVPDLITPDDADQLIRFICEIGERYNPSGRIRPALSDPDDDFILELALEARVDYIVTFNLRDFARAQQFGINIIQPGRFLKLMQENS